MIKFRVLCSIAALVFIISAVWRIYDTVKSLKTESFRITTREPKEGPMDTTVVKETGFNHGQSMVAFNFYSNTNKPIREYNPRTGDSISIYPRKVMACGIPDEHLQEMPNYCFLNTLNTALLLADLVIYIYIAVLFLILIVAVVRQRFFRSKVVLWLRLIGFGFLLMAVIHTAALLSDNYFSDWALGIDWLKVNYRRCVDWSSSIIGLFILAVTEIVKRALELKRENEQFI